MNDAAMMARAVKLAQKGRCSVHPNPLVGCVLVKDGRIISEGFHDLAGHAHAEVHALRSARESVVGATAVVTLEPCAHHGRTGPCVDALISAKLARVVVGMRDPFPAVAGQGIAALKAAGIAVTEGVLEQACRSLNPGFLSLFERHRPYVMLKSAMSVDGRTALSNGVSQWITSEASRQDVQRFRAQASCVLSTARTVIADNARLSARDYATERRGRAVVRVVIDRGLQLTPELALFHEPAPVWVLTEVSDADQRRALEAVGARVVVLPHINLAVVMDFLTNERQGLVWVEAGATFSGALLNDGWVDEWVVYQAPVLLGDQGLPLARVPAVTQMSEVSRFKMTSVRQVGCDLRLTLRPSGSTD